MLVKGILFATYVGFNVNNKWYVYYDVVSLTLQSLAVILNPLVYFYSKGELRKEVRDIFWGLLKITNQSNTTTT